VKRALLLISGFACLGLGAVGIALPIMPTTPFVICAAVCFSASSPSLYGRLAKMRYFGEYIRNYREGTGISRGARLAGLIMLWAMLAFSAVFVQSTEIRILLACIGAAVSVHLLMLRGTKRRK
jgi:uncharacterized membrane protein YbaN (DUF454 family)